MDQLDWKRVKINEEQNYEWRVVESRMGKIKKYAEIRYYFYGDVWTRMVEVMKRGGMRPSMISFYKGGNIDEINKIVYVAGHFPRGVVSDKHIAYWRSFFGGSEPSFKIKGKIVRLPSVAGDNDSLLFYVNGENVNTILVEPDETDIAA
jgi:hypothetical protein